jgi:peptidoglycan/xylan/chitin deacetylase (PgdA/CDA1 family)
MSIPSSPREWRFSRPGRQPLFLVLLTAAALLVFLVPIRSLNRLRLTTQGVAKEVQCAWSRWIARRDGVIVFSRGAPREKIIALTFDDGPHPRTCTAILDVLRHEGVRATFFPVGFRLQQYPELLDRIIAEGHEVGNHTWDHQRLSILPPEKVRWEIRSVRDLVYRRTGFVPALVRPPGGTYDTRVLKICRDEGFEVCLWSANAGDWKPMTANEIVAKVLEQVRPGAVVLMHDERIQTAQALPRIIHALRDQGYRFVTASELRGAPPPAFEVPIPPRRWNIARVHGDARASGENAKARKCESAKTI